MSIPDMEILKSYMLTLDCGHQRRTSAPRHVGQTLPCLNKEHELEPRTITSIVHVGSGREVNSIGWMSPQAAMLGAYSESRRELDNLPWWRFFARHKARKEAHIYGKVIRQSIY